METNFTPRDLAAHVEAERTQLRLPSRPDLIESAAEYLTTKAVLCGACLEAQARKLTLALLEALSNAVVHGNLEVPSSLKEQGENAFAEALAARSLDPHFAERRVDVLVDYDGDSCRWALTDEGPGFDVDKVLGRDALDEAQLHLASGRGILMMQAFLHGVQYEAGGRRVILTLRKPPGAKKRHQPRLPLQQRLRVAPVRADGTVDWDAAYEAVSRNCSAEGIAFFQQQLAAADRVVIGIHAAGRPVYFPAEVRHWRQLGDNVLELGCRFPTAADAPEAPEAETAASDGAEAAVAEALGPLLDRYLQERAAPDERRTNPRVPYTARIEVHGRPGAAPTTGFARDLSRGGISFISTAPLALEPTVVGLPREPGQPPLLVRVQVAAAPRSWKGFMTCGQSFWRRRNRDGRCLLPATCRRRLFFPPS
jgi:anti-sigma regulatory factor (Ser/Thr protein kinase)